MTFVVTSAEMRKCERAAVRDLALPVSLLMEHAGLAVVDVIERLYGPLRGKHVVVLCGKGNNGGDGWVAARALVGKGVRVTVLLCARLAELKGLPRTQAARFTRLLAEAGPRSTSSVVEMPSERQRSSVGKADVIIDAVFGTGFSGAPRGLPARAIAWMNAAEGIKIAVDIPSGLHADSGEASGAVVRADCTVTFQARKLGLLIGEGRTYAGRIEAVDIGIGDALLARHATSVRLADAASVHSVLPLRPRTAHKHSVGKVLVVAGSVGFAGAAAMSAQSALRAGAGAVILVAPRSLYGILSRKLTEVMVIPASETAAGTLAAASWKEIEGHLEWADVAAVGPGLSRNEETVEIIHALLRRSPARLLLDADGINAFSGQSESFRKRKGGELVLTPHAGEFSRLTGLPVRSIERDRLGLARAFAKRCHVTLVLKGAPTITAAPSGEATLNNTGNPGMATAGAGDILTGIMAGLWAQGMEAAQAAVAAVYLHGLAGDLARDRLGERSLLALDLLDELPAALLALERGARADVL